MNLLPDEILYEILLDKEVDDIDEFCYSTKKNTRICESLQFWQDKLIHDHLPPLLIDQVRNVQNYSTYLGIDRYVDTYIELYNQMENCYEIAKAILFINKVESFNKITNGSIIINNPHYNDIQLYSYLPQSDIEYIDSLMIEVLKNQYILHINYIVKINITEEEVILILTYLIFDNATAMIFDNFDEEGPEISINDIQANSFLVLRSSNVQLNRDELAKKAIYQTYLYLQH